MKMIDRFPQACKLALLADEREVESLGSRLRGASFSAMRRTRDPIFRQIKLKDAQAERVGIRTYVAVRM